MILEKCKKCDYLGFECQNCIIEKRAKEKHDKFLKSLVDDPYIVQEDENRKFAIGQIVYWINEYGVHIGYFEIIGHDKYKPDGDNRYYLDKSVDSAYWASINERHLHNIIDINIKYCGEQNICFINR